MGERERERVGWVLREGIRELEVLLPSEKKSEQEREKESERQGERRERDPPRRAENPCFEGVRKTEKELRREKERGILRSKRQRQSTEEKERDREYNVTRAAHISTQCHTLITRFSLPIHIQHHHACSSVENNILSGLDTVVEEMCLWCLTLVSKLQQAHCSAAFISY